MFKKLAISILSIACVAFALAGCGGGDDDGVGVGPGPSKPVYAETQYTWNADYTQCTASKKCISNPQLSITETQNSRVISERKGNCYEMGYIEVSVEFENPELEPRTETFTTPISHEEIVDIPEKAPNCLSNGSTAGTWCESCEQYIVEPTPIPTTVTHNFVNGHCDLCNTDYFTKGLSFLPYYTQDEYYVCLESSTALEDDEVVIPAVYNGKPVIGIVDYAFENTNITSVIIPDSVTDLGMGTFRLCDYLSTVKLPSNITEIGPALFEDCESLKEIIVPTGVKTIGGSAFYGVDLDTFVMPDTVTTIGNYAFENYVDSQIENFYLNGDIRKYIKATGDFPHVKNFYSWHMNGSVTLDGVKYEPLDEITISNVPDGSFTFEKIPEYIFYGVETLKFVQIGNMNSSAEIEICDGAFYACKNLKEVILLDNVSVIGGNAFGECSSLETLQMSGGTKICFCAFSGTTKLTGVNLPDTLYEIEYSAFAHSGIKFVNLPPYLDTIGEGAFTSCSNLEKVGASWYFHNNDQSDRRPQDMALTTLPERLFAHCTNLKSVVLPKSVTTVSSECFFNCVPTIYYTGTETEFSKITFGNQAIASNTKAYFYSANKNTGCWYYASNGDITIA